MLQIYCYVYRTNSQLFLSVAPPKKTAKGTYRVAYNREVPIHKRYRLPIGIDGRNHKFNKIIINNDIFPEVNIGEFIKVLLSIVPAADFENLTKATGINEELVLTNEFLTT